MNCASRLAASALLLAGACSAVAQERRPNELPDHWLVSARAVSDDLSADAPALPIHHRALLWARLGEVWWKDDGRRARALLLKAVEEVEADEPGVTSAVASIDDRLMRAWARLGLLKALLERRQAELSAPAGPRQGKAARGSQAP